MDIVAAYERVGTCRGAAAVGHQAGPPECVKWDWPHRAHLIWLFAFEWGADSQAVELTIRV